jgi:hypothetical protein
MKRAALPFALLAAVTVASCDTTPEPYHVGAIANLEPITTASGRPTTGPLAGPISGPLEVLDNGEASQSLENDYVHVVAAYHVQLPDGAAPWVRIFAADSCDAPGDDPEIIADLGTIRRVGRETHFFHRHVEVAGSFMDVDIQVAAADLTLYGGISPNLAFGKLAVVLVPGDEAAPTGPGGGGSGNGSGNDAYPRGGPWLACGVFVQP